MLFRRRRQHLDAAVAQLDQTVGAVGQPEVVPRAPLALKRQNFEDRPAQLAASREEFVTQWGALGTSWGINRTMAQIHALLFLSPRPLHAEEISATLGVARSNVSTSLRELQGWGIVRRVHVMGDRRDHFDSLKDVWELFRTIAEERKKREIDPTIAVLRSCVEQAEQAGKGEALSRERLAAMLEFFEMTNGWYDQVGRLPTGSLLKLIRGGDRLKKLFRSA